MAGQAHQLLNRDIRLLAGLMRVRADRAAHRIEPLSNGGNLGEAAHPRRNGHEMGDARRLGAGHNIRQFGGEVGKIEMAMAVDEHDDPAGGARFT